MIKSGLSDENKYLIAGIGELLWDIYPDYKRVGGAPANVAYHVSALGDQGIILSRLGMDDLGFEIEQFLWNRKVETRYLQKDVNHPTGTMIVTLKDDSTGYTFTENVAWDYLELSPSWSDLARKIDAVNFGILAQRNSVSKTTIQQFLTKVPPSTLKVMDVNLRKPFYTKGNIAESIKHANVIKMNLSEYQILSEMFGVEKLEDWLFYDQDIAIVCLTKGKEGSELITKERHIKCGTEVVDTVKGDQAGAGDAFTATLIHFLLRKTHLESALKSSSIYAAKVASRKGAMPDMSDIKHHY